MKETYMEAESYYDVLVNEDDEIMITIKARESEPEDPVLVYAGGEHALLYRNKEYVVILDFIHPGVRALLQDVKEVLIAELADGQVVREYEVPTDQVEALPVDEEVLPKLDD